MAEVRLCWSHIVKPHVVGGAQVTAEHGPHQTISQQQPTGLSMHLCSTWKKCQANGATSICFPGSLSTYPAPIPRQSTDRPAMSLRLMSSPVHEHKELAIIDRSLPSPPRIVSRKYLLDCLLPAGELIPGPGSSRFSLDPSKQILQTICSPVAATAVAAAPLEPDAAAAATPLGASLDADAAITTASFIVPALGSASPLRCS